MKKATVIILLLLTLFHSTAAQAATIQYWLNYQSFRDEYRMDFTWPTGTASYKLLFTSSVGEPFNLSISQPPTGIMYLTCNGTYSMEFYGSGGGKIGEFSPFQTTLINTPTCSSYPDQTGTDGLSATQADNGNGTYNLAWQPEPGAAKYEVWKDGVKQGETTGTSFTLNGQGAVSILARNSSGTIIDKSDMHVPELAPVTDPGGEDPPPGGGECDVCQQIIDALDCPGWDEYMGELTNMVKAALPTIPEWHNIAQVFVDEFAEYFGAVPPPPTVEEMNSVKPPLPPLDSSVPDANIIPVVPPAYNQPQTFDITTGPEIPIVDGSQPIEIYEPNKYIDADGPGVMVFPGDSRNSSGGIKQPNNIITPYPVPVPTLSSNYETPPADIPIPSISPGPGPLPSGGGGGTGPVPGGGG